MAKKVKREGLSVSLPRRQVEFLDRLVDEGEYLSKSAAISYALRVLQDFGGRAAAPPSRSSIDFTKIYEDKALAAQVIEGLLAEWPDRLANLREDGPAYYMESDAEMMRDCLLGQEAEWRPEPTEARNQALLAAARAPGAPPEDSGPRWTAADFEGMGVDPSPSPEASVEVVEVETYPPGEWPSAEAWLAAQAAAVPMPDEWGGEIPASDPKLHAWNLARMRWSDEHPFD